jgi:hypothetical protein
LKLPSRGIRALRASSTSKSLNCENILNTMSLKCMPHKPLSNPLTAEDRGGSGCIFIDSFTMAIPRRNVHIESSGTIVALANDTLYYVYFDDPRFASQGTTSDITYHASTRQVSAGFGGRFFVGSIRTPKRGESPTIGNGDGGTPMKSEDDIGVVGNARPGNETSIEVPIDSPVSHLVQLADSFPRVVLRLRTRHANRTPLLINDEYDVQDVFAALLETRFNDVRREEWGPSYAGGATRADFFLKNESVIFETKMMREGLNDRKLGEELIIDIAHYRERPSCKALVCFVYDPEHRLKNPRGLENDLSKVHDHFDVQVLVRPKP